MGAARVIRGVAVLALLPTLAAPATALTVLDGPDPTGDAWAFIVVHEGRGLWVDADDASLRVGVHAPGATQPDLGPATKWSSAELPHARWRGVENATRVVVAVDTTTRVRLSDADPPRAGIEFELTPHPGPPPPGGPPARSTSPAPTPPGPGAAPPAPAPSIVTGDGSPTTGPTAVPSRPVVPVIAPVLPPARGDEGPRPFVVAAATAAGIAAAALFWLRHR